MDVALSGLKMRQYGSGHDPALAVEINLVLDAQQPQRADADGQQQDHANEEGLKNTGLMSNTIRRSPTVRMTKAPKIEPMTLPTPPNREVPPITTAAMESERVVVAPIPAPLGRAGIGQEGQHQTGDR